MTSMKKILAGVALAASTVALASAAGATSYIVTISGPTLTTPIVAPVDGTDLGLGYPGGPAQSWPAGDTSVGGWLDFFPDSVTVFSESGAENGSFVSVSPFFTLTGSGAPGSPFDLVLDYGPFATTNGDTITVSVPEPASWALMLAGFGLVGYGLRRRSLATASA